MQDYGFIAFREYCSSWPVSALTEAVLTTSPTSITVHRCLNRGLTITGENVQRGHWLSLGCLPCVLITFLGLRLYRGKMMERFNRPCRQAILFAFHEIEYNNIRCRLIDGMNFLLTVEENEIIYL
jgi:hypothetical protein